ncbi:LacI family DNA-binding transcriptional regulator [Gallibacterium anatis]|uniref:LacI family transcriptional regulator n=1 Tax=Gallibacterium anatis TaxID=750 RepID=A0A921L0N7_9PAST|nr:LacI family transcriptional regulator [Gallibacterium anatis]
MQKKATINDVAKLAKVSKATVSRFLNKKFNLIAPDTVARIEKAVEKLNYFPSQIAQGVKRGNTKLIALIVSDINNSYSIELFQGVEKYAFENDYALLLFSTNDSFERETKILKSLSSYQVEGVIIQSLQIENYVLSSYSIPVVSVDREISNYKCDLVGLDNKKSTRMMIDYLLNKKFNALLFVTENVQLSQARSIRVQTFKEYIVSNINVIGKVLEVNDSENSSFLKNEILNFFIKNKDKKIAIISVNGKVALNLLSMLEKIEIKVGKDIGFITFDNPNWSNIIPGGISVLEQPTYDIGYMACKLLINRINKSVVERNNIAYSGRLIERGSTIL